MKNLKLMLALALALAMCTNALAAPAGSLSEDGDSTSTIPVTISAEATVFNVDVPTAFPSVVDPVTGETVEGTPTITNNSYGSIKVASITVKDNATETTLATWHLTAYDTDMSKVAVDSNVIGMSVAPKKGDKVGTALTTTDEDVASQVLYTGGSPEWVMSGKTATDGSNKLTVVYDTNVSAVSETITDVTAANIVLVIAWNA